LKATPVEVRKPEDVNRTLEELKAGKVLGRVVLDFEAIVSP
jgi:D-arabinose 1-dehydrogenase-like Zn-dependent alcohol dehydrogenase